jgi:Phage integrase central domain
MADWLEEGLPGRTAKTVETNRDSLRPLLAVIGRIPLKDLTVQDVRGALKRMAGTHATRTLQKAHNCLTRAVRHAEGQDLVRRNVSALVDTPRAGGAAVAVADAGSGFGAAGGGGGVAAARVHRAMPADRGPVGGGAGADVGARGPGGRDDLGVAVGAGARGHQDEPVAADAEAAGDRRGGAARAAGAAGSGAGRWVPKELRTSFVSMMSYQGVPVEEIARLAGHASSRTTEVIYRRELRPVITTGAEVMDQIFRSKQRRGNVTVAG